VQVQTHSFAGVLSHSVPYRDDWDSFELSDYSDERGLSVLAMAPGGRDHGLPWRAFSPFSVSSNRPRSFLTSLSRCNCPSTRWAFDL
jgi:hypothetical protein